MGPDGARRTPRLGPWDFAGEVRRAEPAGRFLELRPFATPDAVLVRLGAVEAPRGGSVVGRHRRRRRHPTPSGDSDSAVSANSSVFRHFRNSVDRICNRPKTTILESIDPHVPIKITGVDVSQPQRASFRPQLFHRASRTVRGTTRSASHRRSKKPSSTMARIAQIRAVPATVAPRLSLRSNRRAGASHSPTFPTRSSGRT